MEKSSQLDLNDVIDLSVVELYILNYLIKIAGSVIRFSALNDINQNLDAKKLSRSSFYNSLEKLEKKGFVEIIENTHGKGSLVKATILAREAVKQVNLFSIWGTVDIDMHFLQFLEKFQDQLYGQSISRQLIIPFSSPLNETLLTKLTTYSHLNSIIATDEDFTRLEQKISRTDATQGVFREPDGFFDVVTIYRYHINFSLYNYDIDNLMIETSRVLRKGGNIIILTLDVFSSSSNLMLESMINDLFEHNITEKHYEVIEKSLKEKGLLNIEKISYKGLVAIIATK